MGHVEEPALALRAAGAERRRRAGQGAPRQQRRLRPVARAHRGPAPRGRVERRAPPRALRHDGDRRVDVAGAVERVPRADLCGNQNFTERSSSSTPWRRRLLDSVAVPVPHRAPDALVDFHTGADGVEEDVVVREADPVPRPRGAGRVGERRVALAARPRPAVLVRAVGREEVRVGQARAHERAVARRAAAAAGRRALEALLHDEDDAVEALRPRVERGQGALGEPMQRLGVRAVEPLRLAGREHVDGYPLLLPVRRGEQQQERGCPHDVLLIRGQCSKHQSYHEFL